MVDMKQAVHLNDYEIVDTLDNEKLERIGEVTLRRPDALAKGPVSDGNLWSRPTVHYQRKNNQEGTWITHRPLPEPWLFHFNGLEFKLFLSNNKHIGVFFEQANNWTWLSHSILSARRPIRVLNLFGYTGVASLVAMKAGAVEVVHVEASKSIINVFKENRSLNNMNEAPIRPIQEDAFKFVEREIKRGHHYDLIVLDPPKFGKGPNNEQWHLDKHLESLLERINVLLSDDAFGVLLSSYSDSLSAKDIELMLKRSFEKRKKTIEILEWELPITHKTTTLSAGLSARIIFK